jgi:hypothetical protein
MRKAYVGIIGPRGLEVFHPEDDCTADALARRVAAGQDPRSVCLWAVLPDDAARTACRQISRGETLAPLATIDRTAECVGRVLPPEAH